MLGHRMEWERSRNQSAGGGRGIRDRFGHSWALRNRGTHCRNSRERSAPRRFRRPRGRTKQPDPDPAAEDEPQEDKPPTKYLSSCLKFPTKTDSPPPPCGQRMQRENSGLRKNSTRNRTGRTGPPSNSSPGRGTRLCFRQGQGVFSMKDWKKSLSSPKTLFPSGTTHSALSFRVMLIFFAKVNVSSVGKSKPEAGIPLP